MSSRIDNDIIERVRSSLDISDVIGDYISLKRRGAGDYWGLCPFHGEKTSSFHVRADRGMFHCFGCGRGGNVFTFLMEVEGISFFEALKTLADRAGIELPGSAFSRESEKSRTERDLILNANSIASKRFHDRLIGKQRLPEAVKVHEYVQNRGFTDEIVRRYRIGWADSGWDGLVKWAQQKGIPGHILVQSGLASRRKDGSGFVDRFRARLMFPILNLSGKPIAFGGRRIEGITPDDDTAKYVNSPETAVYRKAEHLYGLYNSRDDIRKAGFVYLVEGYTDLLALVQAGVVNCVASLGTALTIAQSRLLKRFINRVIIIYDSDSAGVAAAIRAADILIGAELETRLVQLPSGDDPDSLLRSGGKERLLKTIKNDVSFIQFRLDTSGFSRSMGHAERIECARSILETIKGINDPLRYNILLEELADRTAIGRETLERSLAQMKKRPTVEETATTERTTFKVPSDCIAEHNLIHVLLGHPEIAEKYLMQLSPDLFLYPPLRAIYQAFEKAELREETLDITSLPERFDDPDVRAFIAEAVLNGQQETGESAKAEFIACLNLIKRRDLKRQKRQIELQINEAKKTGQSTRDLMGELVELGRKLKSLNE